MGANEVDWARYLDVESRATSQDFTALGDPARWGGQADLVVTPDGNFASEQLARVQTFDPYSRLWSLLGNITASPSVWALDNASFQLYLEVTMGTGQNTVLQRLNLRAIIALAAPWYTLVDDGARQSKPFIVTGGVIGRAVSTRVVALMTAAETIVRETITASVLVTPFAAGHGI